MADKKTAASTLTKEDLEREERDMLGLDDPVPPEPEQSPTPEADQEKPADAGTPAKDGAPTEPAQSKEGDETPEPKAKADGTVAEGAEAPADPLLREVEHKGRKWTVKELIETGELDKIRETAAQLPELQRVHAETKRERDELREKTKAGPAPAPAGQTPGAEQERPTDEQLFGVSEQWKQLRQHVIATKLPTAVKTGAVSETLAASEPELAADLIVYRIGMDRLDGRLAAIEDLMSKLLRSAESTVLTSHVSGVIDSLAPTHPLLAKSTAEQIADIKAKIIPFLVEQVRAAPSLEQVTAEYLSPQLWALLAREYPDLMRQLTQVAGDQKKVVPALGSTPVRGAGGTKKPATKLATELADLAKDFDS